MREMYTFSRRDRPAQPPRFLHLGLAARRNRSLLLFKLRNLLLVLHQRVGARHGGLHAGLHHFLGELFLVEDHHFFHVAHAALQVFAQRRNLADHDGRARNRLEHAHLAALDALGDLHFAFARKQRHGAHLAQIHAHRVIGLLQRSRRQIQLNVLPLLQLEFLVAGELGSVEQVDALRADGRDQIVQIVGRANLIRQRVVHFAVGQIALFLAGLDQAVHILFELVVNRQNIPALFSKMRSDDASCPARFLVSASFEPADSSRPPAQTEPRPSQAPAASVPRRTKRRPP